MDFPIHSMVDLSIATLNYRMVFPNRLHYYFLLVTASICKIGWVDFREKKTQHSASSATCMSFCFDLMIPCVSLKQAACLAA